MHIIRVYRWAGSKYDYPEGYRYYDEGWNDYLAGKAKPDRASDDYWSGWNDCADAEPEDKKPIFIDAEKKMLAASGGEPDSKVYQVLR